MRLNILLRLAAVNTRSYSTGMSSIQSVTAMERDDSLFSPTAEKKIFQLISCSSFGQFIFSKYSSQSDLNWVLVPPYIDIHADGPHEKLVHVYVCAMIN